MEKRASNERGIVRRLVATLIVTVGVAIVWGVVLGWAVALVDSWTNRDVLTYENILVTRSGVPIIQSYSSGNYQDMSYRTLDGRPFDLTNQGQLGPAYLAPAAKVPPLFDWPLGWGESLGATDYARPLGAWYLMRDNRPSGHAYFVGYDEFSKRVIGYIGRRGFRRSVPSNDEWFDVGRGHFLSVATSTQRLQLNSPAESTGFFEDSGSLSRWFVFVFDGDRVLEVDLQARSVREVFAAANRESVGFLIEAAPPQAGDDEQSISSRMSFRLAVRAGNRVSVLEPSTGASRAFTVPESFQNEQIQVYSLDDDQVLFIASNRRETGEQIEHLVWVDAEGKVAREETYQLAQYARDRAPTRDRTSATLMTGLVPIPSLWPGIMGLWTLVEYQQKQAPTFGASLAKVFDMLWPALLIVAGIGCLSAWLVWRWQRKYFRPHTGAWCTFAFLLGLPAVVAYWLEMRRAKLETCGECRTMVPRDRAACASCATPFPAPPLLGTELFA